jgi:hypothetical protein
MILDAPNSTAAAFGSGVVKHNTTLASNTDINNKSTITNNINVANRMRIYPNIEVVIALAVAIVGPLGFGWPWFDALYKALVLLVIACPCALVQHRQRIWICEM